MNSRLTIAAGAALALAVAGCTSSGSPQAQASPTTTRSASDPITPSYLVGPDCPVTVAPSSATPPPALHYRPPPPVPYVRDWYGNDALWVMLPADGTLPALRQPDGTLTTRFPWFRLAPGSVKVAAERLDGPTDTFSADVGTVAEYGDRGFTPSILYWSAPGCWRITSQVAAHVTLTFVLRVQATTS